MGGRGSRTEGTMGRIIRFPIPRSRRRAAAGGIAGRARLAYNSAKVSPQVETIIQGRAPFFVGEWLVEPTLNRLTNGGETLQLELKAMDVLVFLATRAGELVAKTELLDAVWETEFVSDNTLTRRIAQLRDALGDDARNPRYIETITKRGYRLIAPVTAVDAATAEVAGFPERAVDGDEEGCPYPGLAAFTEADAEDFFGRDDEMAELWRKITYRRLLAVIGPSGVGKSSLLNAGVMPGAPNGWRAVTCQPGDTPFLSLARALAPDFVGEVGEVRQLLGFADPDVALAMVSRWRGQFSEAVIVVDQFEELFTLNPPPVQDAFVALLRRLVDAADVHVVLVLRDDFFYECHRYQRALAPILKDLTLVGPLAGADLRTALVEPAACGARLRDALLVEEMVDEVADERGALPLLAFAVSRLWELRDRERPLLTREAYEKIGGVAGALAQHAEATLEAIGTERLPIVRELFRNLVTAKGTRAIREVDELLSVFRKASGARGRGAGSLVDAGADRLSRRERATSGPGPSGGDRARVPADRLAAPGPVADSGRRRGSDQRPAAPGGGAVAGEGSPAGSVVVRVLVPRVPGVARGLSRRSERDRGGLRRGHDVPRQPPPPPASAGGHGCRDLSGGSGRRPGRALATFGVPRPPGGGTASVRDRPAGGRRRSPERPRLGHRQPRAG